MVLEVGSCQLLQPTQFHLEQLVMLSDAFLALLPLRLLPSGVLALLSRAPGEHQSKEAALRIGQRG